ncbi:FAD-dependent oxidoreductase [Actinocorallia aurea]
MEDSTTSGADKGATTPIGRRGFVTGSLAAAGAAGLAFGGPSPAAASSRGSRAAAPGKRVAVFGGGMGGLTVAHELAERGFQVTVYERKAWGGKCRSMPFAGTATGGRQDLPAEHGFRFFPGFYQNLPETMARVPRPGGGTLKDNFVDGKEVSAYYGGTKLVLPARGSILGTLSPDSLLTFLNTAVKVIGNVPAGEVAFFLEKMIVFVTSGPQRRLKQWENMSFADFVKVEGKSARYQELLVEMFTSTLVAAKPDKANAHTMGLMAEAWVYSTLGLGGYGAPDRLLNAPTNEALIDPWMAHLRTLGVTFQSGKTLTELKVANGQISGAVLNGSEPVDADHYVLAVPLERAVPLLNNDILAVDPGLRSLQQLTTDWMNGIMIYLKKPVDLGEGHVAYAGQPWALTSISQAQFWAKDFARTYGDGTAKDCLSIDLSAWDRKGILYNKTAKECTPTQIIEEILAQLRKAIPWGGLRLTDSNVHSYFIDPAITGLATSQAANDEPLLINSPSSWNFRPESATKLPNLFLAADYVRAGINLATMEGANEAGRKAANAIIDATSSGGAKATLQDLWQPPAFDVFFNQDDARYAQGKPNAFDILDPYKP